MNINQLKHLYLNSVHVKFEHDLKKLFILEKQKFYKNNKKLVNF